MTFSAEIITFGKNIGMKQFYFLLLHFVVGSGSIYAQDLPHIMTAEEKQSVRGYALSRQSPPGVLSITPPVSPVRTIAEWEELQGLLITWTSYTPMLKQIVAAAKAETRVYIVTNSPSGVISSLASSGIDTVNVTLLNDPYNSVWSRDYGPWSAYTNDVDTLITIDWIYNRPRPLDDAIPPIIATQLGTPLYQTTTPPWDLVHTGGNFMTDGFGTGFSSKLILDDNLPAAGFNVNHTPAEIDTIMKYFMGINRYIRMDKLPYDQIHHIDMHMKLIDEETIVMGEYPPGVADGPQIEANLLYVISNFNSVFGTPYKVIRMPMPPDNGLYPSNGGDYFTYTNASFINNTLIFPTYGIPQDSVAEAIYREALPGYKITGINSTASIGALGALHCITKELGTSDPLLISHQALHDTYDDINPYTVTALMKHRSGIQQATLYFRTDTAQPYQSTAMTSGSSNLWSAQIPAQPVGTTVYYYVEAQSVSGKTQVRPLPAPAGYWHFKVLSPVSVWESNDTASGTDPAFPNPSHGITCVPVHSRLQAYATSCLMDNTGRKVANVFDGTVNAGKSYWFFDSSHLAPGLYMLVTTMGHTLFRQGIVVQ